jgi:hypothetical protein
MMMRSFIVFSSDDHLTRASADAVRIGGGLLSSEPLQPAGTRGASQALDVLKSHEIVTTELNSYRDCCGPGFDSQGLYATAVVA